MPSSFKDLDKKELYRSAIEDFAVEVDKTASAETIRAALLESGVTWADYVKQHPEIAPPPQEAQIVTTKTLKAEPVVTGIVRTAEPAVPSVADSYLVKMNRANPYFEFGRFKFTKDHPFAIMDAESTNRILTEEDGFAIATPAEAQEYYS